MTKVILAYSGGLDTSVILHWLCKQGYDVICFLADVGQEEDFEKAKAKALQIGASKVYIEDLKQEFIEKYIFQALKANAIYEGRYLLGTALARPLIAKKQIELAKKENATIVAHGATGKGNDQVRFELAYLTLFPDVEIISPWKDPIFYNQFKGRLDLIKYAQENNIPITSSIEKPYSIDENIMHTSYESGVLENPALPAPPTIYHRVINPQNAPDIGEAISLEFKQGIPIYLSLKDGSNIKGSLAIFNALNKLGQKHGIGTIDIVENRYVGMKSRGVYQTPAGTILWAAHRDIESLVIDKEVSHLKDTFIPKIAELIYNGFWFSPELNFMMAAIEQSQKNVEGIVHIFLYKGNIMITKRESKKSLYNEELVSMNVLGKYDQADAKGFIQIQALRLKLHS